MDHNLLNFTSQNASSLEYTQEEETIINDAIGILEARITSNDIFTESSSVKRYCQLQLAGEKDEFFCCLFLNNQHRMLKFERLFRGTVDGASVHARPIVRTALELNAAAIVFVHNHPSGETSPSKADIAITARLKESLNLIDVRTLDHIVVGGPNCSSFAEQGLL